MASLVPVEGFSCIMIDPPWNETGGGKIRRGADRHYPLVKTKNIPDVIRGSGLFVPAENAHLYLWVTNNFLRDGLWVMDELGFRYVTMITWAKDRFGLGQYFRGQTEHMLFGVRGRLPALMRNQTTLITSPRRRHSEKPPEAYQLAETVSPGPRLEVFARTERPGWIAWGNEIAGYDSPDNETPLDEDGIAV